MKTGSFTPQSHTALILKVAGVILILGTLLDYIMLAIPPDFLNSQWLADLINEWVSRGTVPLLGLGVLFLGVWFGRESGQTLRGLPTLAFLLSALLGVMFLVLAPLYFNSSRLTSATQTRQINQQAAQAERQLNNLLEQRRQQVNALVSNQDQLTQLEQQLNNTDLSEQQQAQLQQIKTTLDKVKSDPKALDQEVSKARTQGLQQIKDEQTAALDKLQRGTRRDRIHTTLSSLVFAIGYLVIAWTGLGGSSIKTKTSRAKRKPPKKK